MRIISFLFLMIIVFLAGIIFAQKGNIPLANEKKSLFWTESYSFEPEGEDRQLHAAQIKGNKSFLEGLASKIEGLTLNMFNVLLHILYEISRLFYTGILINWP